MKKIVLVLSLALTSALIYASDSEKSTEKNMNTCVLSGHIIDKSNGESLTGVTVKLEGTDQVAFTDFNGDFSFENLKPGQYTVETNLVSYKQAELKVNASVSKTDELNISLETVTEK